MKELYMKQRIFSMRGRFTVKDADEQDIYEIAGSFLKVPKQYTISRISGEEAARVTKHLTFLIPAFSVEVGGEEVIKIKKTYTFFKSRYVIDALGLEIQGDWWDKDFEVHRNGEVIGEVSK